MRCQAGGCSRYLPAALVQLRCQLGDGSSHSREAWPGRLHLPCLLGPLARGLLRLLRAAQRADAHASALAGGPPILFWFRLSRRSSLQATQKRG